MFECVQFSVSYIYNLSNLIASKADINQWKVITTTLYNFYITFIKVTAIKIILIIYMNCDPIIQIIAWVHYKSMKLWVKCFVIHTIFVIHLQISANKDVETNSAYAPMCIRFADFSSNSMPFINAIYESNLFNLISFINKLILWSQY